MRLQWPITTGTGQYRRSINELLHDFNSWWDEFILEAAKPLNIGAFIMGTVDIFTRGGIVVNPAFATTWSIVQALAIDGLFFASLWRFFGGFRRDKWNLGAVLMQIGLFLIVGLMSAVAAMTTMVISFQQLWDMPDSLKALVQLGIDPGTFTFWRSILVVIVTVMIAFTYYTSGDIQYDRGNSGVPSVPNNVPANVPGVPVTVHPVPNSVPSDVPSVPGSVPLLTEGNSRERVKQAIWNRVNSGVPLVLTEVAQEAQVSYSTVRKLAPGVRKELGVA